MQYDYFGNIRHTYRMWHYNTVQLLWQYNVYVQKGHYYIITMTTLGEYAGYDTTYYVAVCILAFISSAHMQRPETPYRYTYITPSVERGAAGELIDKSS